jgi:hypothetical protein
MSLKLNEHFVKVKNYFNLLLIKLASMGKGLNVLVVVDHFQIPTFSHLNEDVRQCVIYDSPDKHGRLIGVEYIISARLFEQLPAEEKKYWHSHVYEVSQKFTHGITWWKTFCC